MPMHPERWKQIDALLQAALRLPVEQQDEFLRRECHGDAPGLSRRSMA